MSRAVGRGVVVPTVLLLVLAIAPALAGARTPFGSTRSGQQKPGAAVTTGPVAAAN